MCFFWARPLRGLLTLLIIFPRRNLYSGSDVTRLRFMVSKISTLMLKWGNFSNETNFTMYIQSPIKTTYFMANFHPKYVLNKNISNGSLMICGNDCRFYALFDVP